MKKNSKLLKQIEYFSNLNEFVFLYSTLLRKICHYKELIIDVVKYYKQVCFYSTTK